eukprot:9453645-Lingulodinium_polyedra.AAC.1
MQRLIVDGCRGNQQLCPPPYTHLATGGGLSELRVAPGTGFSIGGLDIENAFYNFSIPDWLG